MLVEQLPFRMRRNVNYFKEAPRRLKRQTKRLIEAAMKSIKNGEVDGNASQTVTVYDSQLEIYYRISDASVRDHIHKVGQKTDDSKLNIGLIIDMFSKSGEIIDNLNLPRLPELVTIKSLDQIRHYSLSSLRKLTRSLERAVPKRIPHDILV